MRTCDAITSEGVRTCQEVTLTSGTALILGNFSADRLVKTKLLELKKTCSYEKYSIAATLNSRYYFDNPPQAPQ